MCVSWEYDDDDDDTESECLRCQKWFSLAFHSEHKDYEVKIVPRPTVPLRMRQAH